MQQLSVLSTEAFQTAAARLVQAAGLGRDFCLHQLQGGGNNQVFRVEANGCRALLKAYFQHPEDRRDRLGAEYAFCSFVWENGLRSVPQPLGRDHENRLGLYEFIAGSRVLPQEIDDGAVGQALHFFSEVNRHRHQVGARKLPIASEAYFTLVEHLQCIERRLVVLREIEPSSAIDDEAATFVRDELAPTWKRVRSWVEERARAFSLSLEEEIPPGDHCLSPSDFGFHNAIRTGDERLRFLDFEYAGWDDPAKMVCDFFCQVALPIPERYFGTVLEAVASNVPQPDLFRARVTLLMPVYRVKWCCIVLNHFVRVSGNRRRFADAGSNWEEKKSQQLYKARRVLQSVTDERGIYGIR